MLDGEGWPRGLGDVYWPQIWTSVIERNKHASLGRLGSAALVGSQSKRRTIPIQNPRVPVVLDRLDE